MLSLIGLDPDDVLAVLASGFWSESWYLEQYPDVALSGEVPFLHYLVQGWRELRSPGPDFDARWYSVKYRVDDPAVHPLVHYVREGQAAGLRPRADAAYQKGQQLGWLTPSVQDDMSDAS